MSTTDKNDCQGLYDAVLNSDVDTRNGHKGNAVAGSGSEDETLAELAKEYETDDVVGTELQNEQLAKPVNKLFCSQLSVKCLEDWTTRSDQVIVKMPNRPESTRVFGASLRWLDTVFEN